MVDKKTLEEAKKAFPDEYEEALKKMEELKIEKGKELKLIIRYGNTHKLVADPQSSNSDKKLTNKHEWSVYVDVEHEKVKAKDIIESVKFELHPTFRNPERIVDKAPFKVSCLTIEFG